MLLWASLKRAPGAKPKQIRVNVTKALQSGKDDVRVNLVAGNVAAIALDRRNNLTAETAFM